MKKCPYLSTALECYAGGNGKVHCMQEDFHNKCELKKKASPKKEEIINISVNN